MHGSVHKDDSHPGPDARVAFEGWIAGNSLPSTYHADLAGLTRLFDDKRAYAAKMLRGDFVLSHLDPSRQEICIYRGLTSLITVFWSFTGESLRWSVDPLDLLPARPALGNVDPAALPTLLVEYGIAAASSPFHRIHRIPAGFRLVWRIDTATSPITEQFDDFDDRVSTPRSAAEAAYDLRTRLADATGTALAGSSSTVVLLSGGIDSAVVAAEAADRCSNTANIHFTMSGLPGFDNDLASAQSIARNNGSRFIAFDLREHVCPGGDYLHKSVRYAIPCTHVPVNGFSLAAGVARRNSGKFILSGVLADELLLLDVRHAETLGFGLGLLNPFAVGRPFWQVLARAGANIRDSDGTSLKGIHGVLSFMRRAMFNDPTLSVQNLENFGKHTGFSDYALRIFHQSLLADAASDLTPGRTSTGWRALNSIFNVSHLQAAYLKDLRPHGIFHFTPFADRAVIEYLMSMPTAYKVAVGGGVESRKFILRHAYSIGKIPASVVWRTSQARLDTVSATFLQNNFDLCIALLGKNSALIHLGILRPKFVEGLRPATIYRGADKLTRLLGVELWLREFL